MPKKQPTAAPPPSALDSRLASELAALKKATERAIAPDGEQYVVKEIETSVNALSLVRVLTKDLAEEKKIALDKAVPKEVQAVVKATEAEAKRIKAEAGALELSLSMAIGREVAQGRVTKGVTTERGCKLILQRRKEVVIDDDAVLPPEYTKVVADQEKIEAALTEWQTKCEACRLLELPEPPCPVPGARVGEKIVLVTKVPELIEE